MSKKKVQALVTQLAVHDVFGQFRYFKILGYKNSRDALAKHVDDEDKKSVDLDSVANRDGIRDAVSDGWIKNEVTIINESGLYSLIFGSQLPEAKKFKHWVTSEVLPSIRKTGSYSLPKKKEVRKISTHDVIKAVFEKYPDAEPEITGISFSEDENGHIITHYHFDYMLPDGTIIKPEDVEL